MDTDDKKRRLTATHVAVAGAFVLVVGFTGGLGGFPFTAVAVPLGILLLIVAFALSLRRTPEAQERPAQERGERRRAFPVRLMTLGLGLVVASLAIAVVGGDATGASTFIAPAVIAVVLAVVTALFGRFFVPAMVVAALLFFISFASFELELQHPESFGNFVPALWMLLGWAVALAAAIVGFVQRRRRTLRPTTAKQRWVVLLGIALLVAGSALSWFASGASRVTAAKARGATVVVMDNNEFRPNEFELEGGKVARLYLTNEDSEAHTFTIDEIALDEYIGPRGERLVSFEVPRSTRGKALALTCAVSGHEDMDGIIRIQPG